MRRLVPLAIVAALVAAPVVPALASTDPPGVHCHLVLLPFPHEECW